jgi:type II secretory pathway pseudopilin PulG
MISSHFKHVPRSQAGGFVLLDLLVLVVVILLLVGTRIPSVSRSREKVQITIDQNNFRQILRASALYNADNSDYMAHPTWGSDLTGPDGWAYLTSNQTRPVPGAIWNVNRSSAGRDVNSPQFTNQVAYFKVGQVTQYVPDLRTTWCPKDVATRGSGRLRQLWLDRPMKVTSYCWNGTIGGYVGYTAPSNGGLNGSTFKVSDFLSTDWLMWEQNEGSGFLFNDAGNNPLTAGEVFSLRHTGLSQWWLVGWPMPRDLPGSVIGGTADGSTPLLNWPKAHDLLFKRRNRPGPDILLNGPFFRN